MTKRPSEDERLTDWESLIRAIIAKIGPDGLLEMVNYVLDDTVEAEVNFVVEPRRDH